MLKRPLCLAAAAYVAGILLCYGAFVRLNLLIALSVLFVVCVPVVFRRKILSEYGFLLLIPVFLIPGFVHMSEKTSCFEHVPVTEDRKIRLVGEVYKTEVKNGKYVVYLKHLNNLTFLDNSTNSDNQNISNNLENSNNLNVSKQISRIGCIVYLKQEEKIKIGNVVCVEGIGGAFCAPVNEGQFDALMYYRGQNLAFPVFKAELIENNNRVHALLQLLQEVRAVLHNRLEKLMNSKNASILQAMLLGEKQSVEEETAKLYQESAISHILVISGLHFSMIGMFLYQLLRRMGLTFHTAGILSFTFLFAYGLMTGFGTSAIRAFVMFFACIFAQILGKTYDMPSALSLAVLIILWKNPYTLFQCGFLLSVGAVLGIVVVLPVFEAVFSTENKIVSGCFAGLAISVFSLPILLYFFFQTALYSVFLNSIVVPLVSVIMISGMAALGGSIVAVPFGKLLALPAVLIFAVYDLLCRGIQKLPFAKVVTGQPSIWKIIIYYCVLLCGVLLCRIKRIWGRQRRKKNKKKKKPFRRQRILQAQTLAVTFFLIFFLVFRTQGNVLTIAMLDVGQGLCIYIQYQNTAILFDGGSTDVSKVGQYRIVPFVKSHGKGTLDYVIVSHMDEDHINGITEILSEEQLGVKKLLLPRLGQKDEAYCSLEKLAYEHKTEVGFFGKDSRLSVGRLQLVGLHPEETYQTEGRNDASIVIRLSLGEFSMLLTGDIEENAEKKLLSEERLVATQVLQVAHHGSELSSCVQILEVVKPKLALISCGKDNRYGHPHQKLLDRIAYTGCKTFITTKTGQMTIRTNGEDLKLDIYREK